MRGETEVVYAAVGLGWMAVGRSADPVLDFTWLRQQRGATHLAGLTYPLPPVTAEWVERCLGKLPVPASPEGSPSRSFRMLERFARRELAHVGLPTRYRAEILDSGSPTVNLPPECDLALVAQALAGRCLFLPEIRAALDNGRYELSSPLIDCLAVLRLRGVVTSRPAVRREPLGRVACQRCGSRFASSGVPCPVCGDPVCAACPHCFTLGEARGCRSIYVCVTDCSWAPEARLTTLPVTARADSPAGSSRLPPARLEVSDSPWPPPTRSEVSGGPRLTRAQADAASRLERFVEARGGRANCLIRAVCGAGKTEVILPAIARTLSLGRRVLVTAPRREVVRDLAMRLRDALPGFEVALALGGDPGRLEQKPCTVATVHQLLRFREAFDLAVVDEGDAFPFRGDPMLHEALSRSLRPDARVIWLSATPSEGVLRAARGGEVIDIPARPHGYPLPVPEIAVAPNFEQGLSCQCTEFLTNTLEDESARVVVFVPTVAHTQLTRVLVEDYLKAAPLRRRVRCGSSHARDPLREAKERDLRTRRLDVLVSTTILERGVTIPHLHVMVAFADHRVFDWSALVQMAGRAGRTAEYPRDRVLFIGHTDSAGMRKAVEHIRNLNSLAQAQGYLKNLDGR